MKYENAEKAIELVAQIKNLEEQLDWMGRLKMSSVMDRWDVPEAIAEQLREPWIAHVDAVLAQKKAELEKL